MRHTDNGQVRTIGLKEKTRAQVITTFGNEELSLPLPASYDTYRIIRRNPTISLARGLVAASVMAGSWTVNTADDLIDPNDEKKNFIRDQFLPKREEIMENGIKHGRVDFGWQPFELVFGHDEGLVTMEKIKPLLQDITTILIDVVTGAFWGYRQQASGHRIDIPKQFVLHIAFEVEGTQWYGESLLENGRETLNQWREANTGAERYDAKIAGAHWLIHYPLGSTEEDGELKDNFVIATDILKAVESSGSIIVPNTVSGHVAELSNENPAWRIEMLEDKGGRQPTFVDRLKYLDALLVRSLLMPERAILEGQFGTKAEAGEHGDIVVTNVTQWDERITNEVNRQAVDEVLEQNWGKETRGKIFLVPTPLVDAQLGFLRDLYKLLIQNPATVLEEFPTVDTDVLKDRVGVPKIMETAQAGEVDEDPEPGLDLEQRMRMHAHKPTTGGE